MKGPHFFEKRKKEMAKAEKAKQKADRKAQRKAGKGDDGLESDEFLEALAAQTGGGTAADESEGGEQDAADAAVETDHVTPGGGTLGRAQGG